MRRNNGPLLLDEASYRTLFYSGRDAILVHTLTEDGLPGNFQEVNHVACTLLGYERKELLRLGPSDIVPREQQFDFPSLVGQALADNGVLFEKEFLTKDGKRIPVEIHTHVFTLHGVTTFLAIARDISARKRMEEALRDSEQRFRALAEATSEGVAIHEKGIILEANQRLAEMLGYTRDEIIGMNALDLTAPESREIISHNIQGGYVRPYEAVGLRKDGSKFTVEIRAKSIPYLGKLVRVTTVLDITEFKQEQALRLAIYRISEAANETQTLDDLYRSIHKIVAELMQAANFYIAVYDRATETMSFPYFVDEHDAPPAPRKRARGLTEYVLRTGAPLQAPRKMELELEARGEVELLGTAQVDWLGVPLRTKEGAIGVLVVQSYSEGLRFSEREKNILQFVSTQVAMAIQRKQAEDEQRRAEERYRSFVQQSSDGIWRIELEQPVSTALPESEQIRLCYQYAYLAECNDAMARMYGFSRASEMTGMRLEDMLPKTDPHNIEYLQSFIRSGYRITDAESHEIGRDGNPKYFLNNLVGTVVEGNVVRAWGSQRDLTERRKADEALRGSEERYRMLFERNLAGVFRSTLDGLILDCNDSFARILGYSSREELLGTRTWDLYPSKSDRESFLVRLQNQQALTNLEIALKKKDGSLVWVLENVSLITREAGAMLIEGTLVDITDRRRAEERVAYQAYHDELTGLPNRNLFRDRLNQSLSRALRQGTGLGVLFLDLDQFKLINDTLGHSVGDWLLKQVAQLLRKSVREGDTVARLGGDEFILLLPEISRGEDAARVAQKVLDVISQPLNFDSHDLYITTSIGVSLGPGDGMDAETLIKSADNAMYRAKELGRNNYQFWSPELNVRAHERLEWERNIRRAIENNEFIMHYQPQFFMDSGFISGVEALIRWNHPEKGLVQPMDFIPIAEESRLILPIGEWCLRTACRQMKEWQDAGCRGVRLSMNLSGRQFQHQNLDSLLENVFSETSIDPSALVFEITETVAMQNVEKTLDILHTLKKRGVGIALDDFGKGYSSLSYLKHFPIDIIKIDPSFVKDLENGPQEAALVRSIIDLGHSMKRTIIAEGVETEAQHTFLRFEGCEEMQGFLLCRPLPPAQIKPLLLRGRL